MASHYWQAARLLGDWTLEQMLTHRHDGKPGQHTHRLRGYGASLTASSKAQARAIADIVNQAYLLGREVGLAESRGALIEQEASLIEAEQWLTPYQSGQTEREAESNG